MTERSPVGARLSTVARPPAGTAPVAVVLVIHGGKEHGTRRCFRWMPQVVRCRLLAWAVARRWPGRQAGALAVYLLQHAWTGWDGDGRDPLADAAWALGLLGRRHPGTPVVLIGHSMGARTAVHSAATDGVVGIVGMAPWLPAGDPVSPLLGRTLAVVQGTRDAKIPTAHTEDFLGRAVAAGVDVRRRTVLGGGHAMLFRMGTWSRLATESLIAILGGPPRP